MSIIGLQGVGAARPFSINYFPAAGLNSWTGYGKLSIGIARALQARGVQVNLAPDSTVPTLVVGFAEWLEAPHVVGTRRWLLTQSESDRVSQEWVDLINWHADGVLVTNPDLVDIYRSSGIERPVYFVGHGLDPNVPHAPGWDGESRFEWLTYTLGGMRKGGELVMQAFHRLFNGNECHHLTIKARDHNGWIEHYRCDDPQVTVVLGQQSEREWYDLLARAHCFVFPSRAEGFGMPPREATLMGVPTIATEWLGLADVGCWGFPIRVAQMTTCQYSTYGPNAKGAKWAMPDTDHLVQQMQYVYDNYGAAREQARQGGWHIRYTNNFDRMVGRVLKHMGVER